MKLRIKAHTCEWMRRISLVLSVFYVLFVFLSVADFSGARNGLRFRDLSGAGVTLWVFIILGAIIVLLQLIPAIILLFSFLGTGTHTIYEVVDDKVKKGTGGSCCEKK